MNSTITIDEYTALRQKQISQIVMQQRTKLGWSQQQLADQLHCSRARINRIEQGKASYSHEELEFLNALFGLPATYLTRTSYQTEDLANLVVTNQLTHAALTAHHTPRLPDAFGAFASIAFCPGKDLLIVANNEDDAGILLGYNTSGQLLWRYDHPTYIGTCAFSPDGKHLAFGTENDTVLVLDIADRAIVAILDPVEQRLVDQQWWDYVNGGEPGYGHINSIAFSPNGKRLAYLNEDIGTIRLWNTTTWQSEGTLVIGELYAKNSEDSDDDHDASSSYYGEVLIRSMQFSTNGQVLILLHRSSPVIEFIGVDDQSLHSLRLDYRFTAYAEIFTQEGQELAYTLVTGDDQVFEIFNGVIDRMAPRYARRTERGEFSDLLIVDYRTILARTCPEYHDDYLTIRNLVNNKVITLYAPGVYRLAFSAKASHFAYIDGKATPPILHIYALNLDVLRNNQSLVDLIHFYRDPRGEYALKKALPVEGEPEPIAPAIDPTEGWGASYDEPEPLPHPPFTALQPAYQPITDMLNVLESGGQSSNAEHDGFFIAYTHETPDISITTLIQSLNQAGAKTLLATLPSDNLQARDIASALTNRKLLNGETTGEVLTEITARYADHITILDHAEFISGDTLYWLGQSAKTITRMVILLVHDQTRFEQHCQESQSWMWLEARMDHITLRELTLPTQ